MMFGRFCLSDLFPSHWLRVLPLSVVPLSGSISLMGSATGAVITEDAASPIVVEAGVLSPESDSVNHRSLRSPPPFRPMALSTPEAIAPEMSGPEAIAPEMSGPEAIAPEMSGPEMNGPEMSGPEMNGPEMSLSEMSVSNPAQLAQTPSLPREPIQPPSIQPQPESPPPQPLPPPEDLLQPSTPPSGPTDSPEAVPDTIVVDRFEVTGSRVFSAEEFAAVTEPFTRRPLTLTELFQARDAVTDLYVKKGYITSGAYIPPQTLQGGVVEIRVLEGRVEEIRVRGNRRLSADYIRSRVALGTGQPLNRQQLLEALQVLKLNPLIANLSAELSTGTTPGQSLLDIQITEARSFSAQALLDNGRSPSVGTGRQQVQLSEGNLLGLGDRLTLSYTHTKGSNAGDLSYTLPINPRNGTLSVNVGAAGSRVTEEPFDDLDITSRSSYYELTYRQPIVQKPGQEIGLGLTATHRTSRAQFFDGKIPFPAEGADAKGRTRLSAVRFFQDATWRSSNEVIALRSQFSLGVDALNATINDGDRPDSEFLAWRGQAQWVRLLAPDTLLLLRGDIQLSDRPLLPFEQFGVGGQDSVRGYRQDALLTDNGVFASAEVRWPLWKRPQSNTILHVTPFFDWGSGWNRGERDDPKPRNLASVGLGLRLQMSDRLTAKVEWGIPLVSISGRKRTLQENGIYFSIIWNPW